MNKMIAIISGLTSLSAFAIEQPSPINPANNSPMLSFRVEDTSNTVARDIGRTYSASNKHHRLCWTAFNMPFNQSNQVIEVFKAPANVKFADPNASIVTSKDGKIQTITARLPSHNNEFIERCWRFDKNDPKGKYSVDIRVNNVTFPTQTFELVK